MNLSRFASTLLLLGSCLAACGCLPSLEGRVTDDLTGAAVEGAEVKIVETECVDHDVFIVVPYCAEEVERTIDVTTTDADGFYVLTDYDEQSYTMVVSHPDYETRREPTPVLDNVKSTTMDIELTRQFEE